MAPKVRNRQTPEPLAETDSASSQAAPVTKTQKVKRQKSCDKSTTLKEQRGESGQPAPGTPRGRPSKESIFLSAVASKCTLHQDIVESVLDALETVAIETLKAKHKFHVSFLHGKLNEKPERLARDKKVFGKVVAVPAQPARKTSNLARQRPF